MILQTLLLSLAPLAPAGEPSAQLPSLFAIRVGRAETIAKGTLQHAVILVEDGKIVKIGEDLPVARGIPVLDRPDWVVMPGLVNAYSRLGLEGEAGEEFNPEVKASAELYVGSDELKDVVKYGVTTLGLYPAGNGICGQSVAIRPLGKTNADLVLQDSCYLKIVLRANSGSKKALQDGFKKADDYADKEKKAKEKWDKDQEKKKSKSTKKEEPKPRGGQGRRREEGRDQARGEEGRRLRRLRAAGSGRQDAALPGPARGQAARAGERAERGRVPALHRRAWARRPAPGTCACRCSARATSSTCSTRRPTTSTSTASATRRCAACSSRC